MKKVAIRNLARPMPGPLVVVYCDTFLCRLRGLMFRHDLSAQEGLLLVQRKDSRLDASIHMMGVNFDLGVVWIDSTGEIVDLCLAKRGKPAYFPRKPACWVLEFHPSRLKEFQIGDKIGLDDPSLA